MGINLLRGTFKMTDCGLRSNLVVERGFYNGFPSVSVEFTRTSTQAYEDLFCPQHVITPAQDEYYTLSFYARKKADSSDPKIICYFYPSCCESGISSEGSVSTAGDGSITIVPTTEWKKYWVTWKTKKDVSGSKNLILGRTGLNMPVGQTAKFDFCGIKFEKGKEATPWTPSPLDSPSYPFSSDAFEAGTFTENTSGIYETIKLDASTPNTRLRSIYTIPVNSEKILVPISNGFSYFILFFKDGQNLKKNSGWKSASEWIEVPIDATSYAIVFKRTDGGPFTEDVAQICGGGVDVLSTKATASITLSRVNDGADAFTIVYDSPNGFELSQLQQSLVITAKVFKGGKELTDAQVNAFGAIKWYENGSSTAFATGKTITLTAPKEVYATLEN